MLARTRGAAQGGPRVFRGGEYPFENVGRERLPITSRGPNTDHIRLIFGEGEVGARIAFAANDGSSDLTIDETSAAKLLGKLEVSTYKAR